MWPGSGTRGIIMTKQQYPQQHLLRPGDLVVERRAQWYAWGALPTNQPLPADAYMHECYTAPTLSTKVVLNNLNRAHPVRPYWHQTHGPQTVVYMASKQLLLNYYDGFDVSDQLHIWVRCLHPELGPVVTWWKANTVEECLELCPSP